MSGQLAQIDSMLFHDQVDSAKTCLDRIQIAKIDNKADSAYYYLLLGESRYRLRDTDSSDSSINYCINFYKGTIDKEKLARSYYYKGVITYSYAKPQPTIMLLKQAEKQAEKTNNDILKHKIYEKLSYFNSVSNENELSLYYAKKAIHIAKSLNDKEREAIALIYMCNAYSRMGNMDSLGICIQNCLPLSNYISENSKAYLYTRMGELYAKREPNLAKIYFNSSLNF